MGDLENRLSERYPNGGGPFIWSTGKSWIYAYSNRNPVRPLVVSFVVAGSEYPIDEVGLRRLNTGRLAARNLAAASNARFCELRFIDRLDGTKEVRLDQERIRHRALRQWFADSGLTVYSGSVGKAVNSEMPSWFSEWQRKWLGGIIIIDLDLMRICEADGSVEVIYESKRSKIPFHSWSPFREDYPNFDVASHVASACGARFRIVYNFYSETEDGQPRVDDASRVALFSYSLTGQHWSRLGHQSFERFVDGAVL